MRILLLIYFILCAIVESTYGLPLKPLPYPLSTNGSQIVGPDGIPVRIAGVGLDWDMVALQTLNYKTALTTAAESGINCVRFTTIDRMVLNNSAPLHINYKENPDLEGLGIQEIMVKFVEFGATLGLKFVFDSHLNEITSGGNQKNGLWYDLGGFSNNTDGNGNVGTISDATFTQVWELRAKLFKGNPAVIGYDLRNEPHTSPGHGVTWGDGSDRDIRAMYERVGNAILAIDPDKLIICEGPQDYSNSFAHVGNAPWGDLSSAGRGVPVQLSVPNKLVYSIHNYPYEVAGYKPDSGPELVAEINKVYGYLITENIAPVWIGECGTNMQTADAQAWAETFISWMNGEQSANGGPSITGNQQGVSWSWWDLHSVKNGADNFGILNATGTGVDPQQYKYWSQLLPK